VDIALVISIFGYNERLVLPMPGDTKN